MNNIEHLKSKLALAKKYKSLSLVVGTDELEEVLSSLQEQVQQLAAENVGLKSAIESHAAGFSVCLACGEENTCGNDDVCRSLDETPATDAVIREIGAKAVEEYSKTVGAEKNGAIYAAKLRAGDVS